jgi:hypothetical protein
VDFGTVNGVATPVTKILVPPYDTNTYSFNYVANLATNLGTFVWTNTYGIAAGTNIVIQTNGALLVINAAGSTATNLTPGQLATIAAAITNNQVAANLGYTTFTNSKYQAWSLIPNVSYLNANAGFYSANLYLGNTNFPEAQNTNMGIVFNADVDLDNYPGNATNSLGNVPKHLKFNFNYQNDIRFNTNSPNAPSTDLQFRISKDLAGNGNDYVKAYNDLLVGRDLRVSGTNYASVFSGNGSGLTNISSANVSGLGTASYSNATAFYLASNPSNYVAASVTNGLATTNFVNTTGSTVSNGVVIFVTNNYISAIQGATISNSLLSSISSSNAASLVIVTNLIASKTNFDNITVTNYSLFKTNAYFAGDIYVTNHAYDVSTSQLDPVANEYVTATFVRSVLNNGAFLYGTTNTIAVGFSNILTASTNTISLQFGANAPSGYTKGFTNFVTGTYPNGPYFASIVSTNTFQAVTGPFVNDFYIQADGSGANHALGIAPDIFVTYDLTNLIPICAGAEQSLTMAATTNLYTWIQSAAQYNSTNATGFYVVRRVRVTSQNGTALYINVKGGSGTATTLSFNTPVTVNANYSGTFTGNGSGLTNIAATGIVGTAITNNASPTFTGLAVGAQTALDVNGNGKMGGVGHTNGVLAGNGSGLTNVYFTNVNVTKIPVIWSGPYNFSYFDYASGSVILAPTFGLTTIGLFSHSMALFGSSTGTKLVTAYAFMATNLTALNVNFGWYYTTNNVAVRLDVNSVSVTPPAINTLFYYYYTNNVGSATNLQSYTFGPYNNGTTSFKIYPNSSYGFFIP